jgi:hypothetical protein
MIYAPDGIFKMYNINYSNGVMTQVFYLPHENVQRNANFWPTPEGVKLMKDRRNKVSFEEKIEVETIPEMTGYFFYSIPYTDVSKIVDTSIHLRTIENMSISEIWEADSFKMGFSADMLTHKAEIEQILTDNGISFTEIA